MKYREILLSTASGTNAVSLLTAGPSGISLLKSYTDSANSSTAHHIGRRLNLNDPDSDFVFQTTVFSKLYNSFTGTYSPQSLTGTFRGFLGNSSITDGYYYHFTTGLLRKIPFDVFDSVSASLPISAPDGRDLKEDETHLYYYDSTSLKKVLKSTLSQDGDYDVGASKTLNFCVGNEYVYSIDSTKTLKKFNKSTKALIGSYDSVLGVGTINSIAVNPDNENIIFVAMGNYVYKIDVTSTPSAESISNFGNSATKYALEPNKDMLIVGAIEWSGGTVTQINMSSFTAVGSPVAVNGEPKHFTMGTELNPSLTYVPVASTITKTNYTLSGTQFTLTASGRNKTVTGSLALNNINLSAFGVPVGVTLTSIKLALQHRSSQYSTAISNTWNASLNGTNVLTQSYSGTTVMTGTTSSSYLPANTTVDANTAVSIAISGSCATGNSSLARSTHILDAISLIVMWEEEPVVNVDGTVTMTNGIQQITLILKSAKNSGSITLGTQQSYTYTTFKPVGNTGSVAVSNGANQTVVGKKLARAPPSSNTVGVKQSLSAKKTAKNSVSPTTLGAQQTLTIRPLKKISSVTNSLGFTQTVVARKYTSTATTTQSVGIQMSLSAKIGDIFASTAQTLGVQQNVSGKKTAQNEVIQSTPQMIRFSGTDSSANDTLTILNPETQSVEKSLIITGYCRKISPEIFTDSNNVPYFMGYNNSRDYRLFKIPIDASGFYYSDLDRNPAYRLGAVKLDNTEAMVVGGVFHRMNYKTFSLISSYEINSYLPGTFDQDSGIFFFCGNRMFRYNSFTESIIYNTQVFTEYTTSDSMCFVENGYVYALESNTKKLITYSATDLSLISVGAESFLPSTNTFTRLLTTPTALYFAESLTGNIWRLNRNDLTWTNLGNYGSVAVKTHIAVAPDESLMVIAHSSKTFIVVDCATHDIITSFVASGVGSISAMAMDIGPIQDIPPSVQHGVQMTVAGKKTSSRTASFTFGFNQTALGKKASSRTISVPNGFTQTLTARKAVSKGTSLQTLGIQQSLTVKKHTARALTVITHGVQQTLSAKKSAIRVLSVLQCGIQQTLTFKKGRNIQIPAQSLGVQQSLTFKKGRNIVIPVQTLGVQQTVLATKKSLISFTESLGVKQTALARKHTTTAISVSNGAVTTGTGRESSTGFLYSTNGDRIFLSAKKAVSSSTISTTVGINTNGTGIESHTVAVSLSSGDKIQMTVKKSVKNTPAVTFLLGNQQTLNGKKLSTRTLSFTLGDTTQLTAKKTAKQGLSLSLGDTVYVEQGKYLSIHVGVQQNITAQKNAIKSVDTSSGVGTSLTAKKNQTTILEPDSLGVKQTVTTLKNVPISVSDSLGERIFVTKKKATQSSVISLTAGIQMNVHMGGKFFVLMGLNQFLSAVKKTVTILPVALGATVSLALMKSTQNFLAESEGIQMTLTAKKAVKQSVSITLNTQETVSGMKQSTVAVADTVGDAYTVEAVKYAENTLTIHHGVLLFVSSVDSAQTTIQMTQGTKQTLTAVKGVTADVPLDANTEESVLGRKNAKKAVTISSGARQTFTATKSTTRALTFSLTPTVAVSSHKSGSSDPVLNSATLFEVLTASAQKFSLEVEPNVGEHIAVTVEKASSDSLLLTLASEMTHEGEKGAESELTDSLGFLIDVTVTRPNLARIKLSHGINLTVIGVRSKYISLADSLGVQVEISTEATSKIFRVKPEKRVGTLFIPFKYTLTLAPKKYVLKLFVPVKVSYKMSPIKRTYKSAKVVRKY